MAELIFRPGEDRPFEARLDDGTTWDLEDEIDPEDNEIVIDDGNGSLYMVVCEGTETDLAPNTIYSMVALETTTSETEEDDEEDEEEAESAEAAG